MFLCWRKVSFLIDGAGSKAALRRAQVLRLIATLPPGRPAPQSDMVRYHVTRAPRRLCGQIRGVVVKIFLLGATGNSGRRILRLALQRAHEVTAFVRDETKLQSLVDRPIPPNLHVSIGDISNSADIARVMVGHDVAINAAGTVTEGSTFTQLVQTVVDSAIRSLGEGGRLWQFGSASVLNVPGTHIMAVDLPKVPKVYEAHRTNLDALRSRPLDWSMLCPAR